MLHPFFIRHNKLLKKINPADVVGLNTEKNYTKIFLKDQTYYLVRSTLSNTLKKLPPDIFVKIHRSYTASVYYIENIYKDYLVVTGNSKPIPIGKEYYKSLMDKLNIIE